MRRGSGCGHVQGRHSDRAARKYIGGNGPHNGPAGEGGPRHDLPCGASGNSVPVPARHSCRDHRHGALAAGGAGHGL